VTTEYILRILAACFLGGLIGIERENVHRPAGFRTHMLVCVGSALIMVTGEYIFLKYNSMTNLDPTRLGAQVVSGIGFLGAGTIIKEGASVKGLTTAASLWAVSCVGLAVGAGFYWVAIVAAALTVVILVTLKQIEKIVVRKPPYLSVTLYVRDRPGQIGMIGQVLGDMNVHIKDIKMESEDDEWLRCQWILALPSGLSKEVLLAELRRIDGVTEEENQ